MNNATAPQTSLLSYVPLNIYSHDDPHTVLMMDELGTLSEWVAVKIRCLICSKGHYMVWDDFCARIIAKRTGATVELVEKTLEWLLNIGYYDRQLFDSERVLTGVDVQRFFFTATARRKDSAERQKYRLWYPDEPCDDDEQKEASAAKKKAKATAKKQPSSRKTSTLSNCKSGDKTTAACNCKQNSPKEKESKAKESKAKESKEEESKAKENNPDCLSTIQDREREAGAAGAAPAFPSRTSTENLEKDQSGILPEDFGIWNSTPVNVRPSVGVPTSAASDDKNMPAPHELAGMSAKAFAALTPAEQDAVKKTAKLQLDDLDKDKQLYPIVVLKMRLLSNEAWMYEASRQLKLTKREIEKDIEEFVDELRLCGKGHNRSMKDFRDFFVLWHKRTKQGRLLNNPDYRPTKATHGTLARFEADREYQRKLKPSALRFD